MGKEEGDEDVSSRWMRLRNRDDIRITKGKH
jgi:hypothetical protein